VHASNPYTGQVIVGATLSFSDGCKKAGSNTCGSFNPASAVTDSNGNAATVYTVPKTAGTYTVTISGTGLGMSTATEMALPAAPVKLVAAKGTKQSGAAGSQLANPIVARVQDTYGNGVPGITVNFTANQGAVPNPSTVATDSNGLASTILQLPTGIAKITVTAGSSGLKSVTYLEYSVAGPAASIAITGGNNQSGKAGTQLPQALTALVTDQYGNPVSGNSVAFSDGGAGGSFSNSNPVTTGSDGIASQMYTLPASPKTVTITATATGVTSAAVFTETGQ
jgi:adhesin/invasin